MGLRLGEGWVGVNGNMFEDGVVVVVVAEFGGDGLFFEVIDHQRFVTMAEPSERCCTGPFCSQRPAF